VIFLNNNLKKTVTKSIDRRERDTKQIVEMTSAQVANLKHWPKNKYIIKTDEILPLIKDDLNGSSTTEEIASKVNAIIQSLDCWMLRRE